MSKRKIKGQCRFCFNIISVSERRYSNGRCGDCAREELVIQMRLNERCDERDHEKICKRELQNINEF